MDAWSTVIGQRTMESINSMARDMDKLPTLRDQFAMSALQGMIANDKYFYKTAEELSVMAFNFADEMLKARKEK